MPTFSLRLAPECPETMRPDCPMLAALYRLGDKWIPLIFVCLAERPHHFGELRRRLAGVSKKMLAQSLRTLDRDGLVSRSVVPETKPPMVRYALTPFGRSAAGPLFSVYQWLRTNSDAIVANGERYDAREAVTHPST